MVTGRMTSRVGVWFGLRSGDMIVAILLLCVVLLLASAAEQPTTREKN